ncbi:MAG: aa3-type cytochrome c oxidase subunit IV [Alphaproteobacteria bacterium]|nr:MAG: aa3-type cytochrome c oxidase subunit IV [Alphaproteobacteria bacterium]
MSEEYKRGEMDISQNQSTWGAFTTLVKFSTIGVAALVFVLTVWLG